MSLNDGRSWQAIVNMLGPDERMKVVCPFGGSSVGSGFFAKDQNGKARYYSAPARTTWWNTYIQPARSGTAVLRRKSNGSVINSLMNLERMLEDDDSFDLWYDSFRQLEMNGSQAVDDLMWSKVLLHMERKYSWGWALGREKTFSLVALVAQKRKRNPVVDYLDHLQWDGHPRLALWLHRAAQGVLQTVGDRAHRPRQSPWLQARHLPGPHRGAGLRKEPAVRCLGPTARHPRAVLGHPA